MSAAFKLLDVELATTFTAATARYHKPKRRNTPTPRDPMYLQWLPLSQRYCFIRGFAQLTVNGQEFFASRLEAVEAAKAEGVVLGKDDRVTGDLSKFLPRRIGDKKCRVSKARP